MAMEILKIFGRGHGAVVWREALIEWEGAQAKAFGGVRHELEEAGCASRASGAGVERRFDFGEPDEFGGNFLNAENGFQAGDVGFGSGWPWAFGKFFDPDLAFALRRRIGNGSGRRAGFGFRRWNFDAEFVGDVEVIEPGLEPEGVRQSFFVAFEEGQGSFGGGAKGGEVDDIFALKFLLDIGAEFFDFPAISVFQDAERVVIEVFVGPLFGGLEEVVESEGVGLGEEGKV